MDVFEIVGAWIGLTYLFLEYRANSWLWPVGILMSLFYVIIFFHGKFYADAAINVYYIGANVYGWWAWRNAACKSDDQNDSNMGISRTPGKLWPVLFAVLLLQWGVFFLVLHFFTDSVAPVGDAFTTAASIVAMWLLARKYLEQWMFWIVVNVVSVALYFWKGLYPTAILYVVYVVMSVFGLLRWKRMASSRQ